MRVAKELFGILAMILFMLFFMALGAIFTISAAVYFVYLKTSYHPMFAKLKLSQLKITNN